ncbi:hypothetical protein B0H10DRAFT_1649062, partial [Mycena sp. CBHHK59/15]
IGVAPMTCVANLLHLIFWLWFHRHFNTSNRTMSLEDEENKPNRPLPAGHITLHIALILHWTLMPLYWVLSLDYSKEVMFLSVVLSAFMSMYNRLHGSGKHFVFRYALNGLVVVASEAGTTLVQGADKSCLDDMGWLLILLNGCNFAMTIYAQ